MVRKSLSKLNWIAIPPTLPAPNALVVAFGKKLAIFNSESPQLSTGTEAVATITSPPSASVIITSSKGNQLKVGQIKKYAFADRSFQGESCTVSIGFKSNSDPRKPPTPLALVNSKVLGVIDKDSFAALSEKVQAAHQSIESLKFNATIQSAPATTAHLIIDPATVRYPEEWTKNIRDRLRELHICQEGAGKGDKFSLGKGFRRALTTPKS